MKLLIELLFHNEIQNDHEALKKEEQAYKPIPVVKNVTAEEIEENYLKIKREVEDLVNMELTLLKAKEILQEAEQKPAEEPKANESGETNGQTISM